MPVVECPICGAAVAAESTVCDECGSPLTPSGKLELYLRKYSPARDLGLLAGLALAGAGIVLVAVEQWLWAILALVLAAVVFLVRWEAGRRRTATAFARLSAQRRVVGARSRGQIELFRLRRELAELQAERSQGYQDLGRATHAGDDAAASAATAHVNDVLSRIEAKEAEVAVLLEEMRERIRRAQAERARHTRHESHRGSRGSGAVSASRRGGTARAGARARAVSSAGSGAVSGRSTSGAGASAGAGDEASKGVQNIEHLIVSEAHGDREPCYNKGRSSSKTPGGERRETCILAEIVPVVDARRICLVAALFTALFALAVPAALGQSASDRKADLDRRISGLRQDIADAKSKEGALTSDIEAANQRIDALGGDIGSLTALIDDLQSELDAHRAASSS